VLKRQQFQSRNYAESDTMTCQWNTGTDFVDNKNSALILKVKFKGNGEGPFACGFGQGSVLNLIRNLRIYHRSGTCYTNTQKINVWRKTYDKYTHSQNWFSTVGKLMGYDSQETIGTVVEGQDFQTFVIPLCNLHPFFDPEGGVMLPANMASGLRIELDLEKTLTAIKNAVPAPLGTPVSYSIEDCYFQTMNVSLMDSAQASLNTVAQKSSLEYIYKDLFTSSNSLSSNTNQVNVDVNKSVSFADHVLAIIQPSSSLADINIDSFNTPFLDGSWDFTLGSLHFPNVKCDDLKLAYHNALLTYDKLKHIDRESAVTLMNFTNNEGIYSCSLERDTALALSQSPVNASRSMRFEIELDTPVASPHLVTVYLTFLTSARSTLLSSKVDI
jgi:hypothetical protein